MNFIERMYKLFGSYPFKPLSEEKEWNLKWKRKDSIQYPPDEDSIRENKDRGK